MELGIVPIISVRCAASDRHQTNHRNCTPQMRLPFGTPAPLFVDANPVFWCRGSTVRLPTSPWTCRPSREQQFGGYLTAVAPTAIRARRMGPCSSPPRLREPGPGWPGFSHFRRWFLLDWFWPDDGEAVLHLDEEGIELERITDDRTASYAASDRRSAHLHERDRDAVPLDSLEQRRTSTAGHRPP
jgi:hypothetical protein